ncbi:HEME-BINDING PROTEIN-RELATED [Salix viminalis]|uniref:HEME-BINDING PROTEIN-RELATED n=1 Tax=Salix viminalis TaxID=40686 RepID=A0A9Q0U1W1_SALVM|nr:HEME-BINDING PROTEIN-RELATED [Salix viminalis]
MESPSPYYFASAAFHLSFIINLVFSGQAVESPEYTPIHQGSDFEIRIYKDISWMSAPVVQGTTFQKSTKAGFHRLYQYIHGANLNSTRLAMTAPVLTTITEASYFVKLSLSASYEGSPPQPDPELNLQEEKWRDKCIAIRKFSGFARDDNIHEEAEALGTSLNEHWNGTLEGKSSYTIAQYNASSHLSGRFNEVWMVVSGCSYHGHDQGKY